MDIKGDCALTGYVLSLIHILEDSRTLMDYINSYQTEAQNDRISRYSEALGVDEMCIRDRHMTICFLHG